LQGVQLPKNKRLLTRVDEKLLHQINRKLALKKFSGHNTSKFIRASIENFFNKDLFAYVQNTNIIIKVLNELKLDLSGVISNSSQIQGHISKLSSSSELVTSVELVQKDIKKQIRDINNLIKLLKPFDNLNKKENILMVRVESQIYSQIQTKIEKYTFIKFDISKFIRASLKYYLDKKYFVISDKKIALARELMKNASQVDAISNDINQIAFYFNIEKEVDINDIKSVFYSFGKYLGDTYLLVNKLHHESLKEF
jgi:hypothetical protein